MGRIGFFYGRTVIAVDSAKPVGQAIVFCGLPTSLRRPFLIAGRSGFGYSIRFLA
jgi:hypothetical protein